MNLVAASILIKRRLKNMLHELLPTAGAHQNEMSAIGTKWTFHPPRLMSAFGSKADIMGRSVGTAEAKILTR